MDKSDGKKSKISITTRMSLRWYPFQICQSHCSDPCI